MYNKKWTKDKVKNQIIQIYEDLGYFPTQQKLKDNGYGSLSRAISNFGGIHHLLNELHISHQCKPKGYWNSWANLVKEIETSFPELIQEKKFPTQNMLINQIGKGIGTVIANHGGINDVATRMGCIPPFFHIATDGHYVNSFYEYIVDEYFYANSIPHEVNGKIHPKYNYKYDFKIENYYIEIWGYERNRNNIICNKYNKNRIKKEKLYYDLGLNLISIENNIFNNNKEKILELLNEIFIPFNFQKGKQKEIINIERYGRYWNKETVLKETKEFIKQHGTENLRKKYLCDNGYCSLYCAIKQYLGGLWKIRNIFNIKVNYKPINYWNNDVILNEIKNIMEKTGQFPTKKWLKENGRSDLERAISKYGVKYFRDQVHCHSIAPRKWSLEILLQECINYIKKYGIENFSIRKLINNNRQDLRKAIDRSGGIIHIKKLLKIEHKKQIVWNEAMIVDAIKQIVNETGIFPTANYLRSINKGGLCIAISRNGGFSYFRKRMNFHPIKVKWNRETVLSECKQFIKNVGIDNFNRPYLEKIKKYDLIFGIRKLGGIKKLRKLLISK